MTNVVPAPPMDPTNTLDKFRVWEIRSSVGYAETLEKDLPDLCSKGIYADVAYGGRHMYFDSGSHFCFPDATTTRNASKEKDLEPLNVHFRRYVHDKEQISQGLQQADLRVSRASQYICVNSGITKLQPENLEECQLMLGSGIHYCLGNIRSCSRWSSRSRKSTRA
nr:hypothetical protein [Tanacetum cinerariifolium]